MVLEKECALNQVEKLYLTAGEKVDKGYLYDKKNFLFERGKIFY
jgi:hypothetical protein